LPRDPSPLLQTRVPASGPHRRHQADPVGLHRLRRRRRAGAHRPGIEPLSVLHRDPSPGAARRGAASSARAPPGGVVMPTRPDTPCSVCGSLLWSGTGSRSPGERVCRPCRRAHRLELAAPEPVAARVCLGCGDEFTPEHDARQYCSANCRQRAKRHRRPKQPPPKPRPPTTTCRDCGAPIPQLPLGSPPLRCAPCRVLRASERSLQRHRDEYAARAAVLQDHEPPRPLWAWLTQRFINRRSRQQ